MYPYVRIWKVVVSERWPEACANGWFVHKELVLCSLLTGREDLQDYGVEISMTYLQENLQSRRSQDSDEVKPSLRLRTLKSIHGLRTG
ncbi:hypothetical protein VNI00_016163 [Paramarasmius palmivorus]|uniref:Uncharacterized protein n=1 Tax=Paramarasmius palmivorus TaxID=297713 RepID=A0AAW0BFE6_9AGAR